MSNSNNKKNNADNAQEKALLASYKTKIAEKELESEELKCRISELEKVVIAFKQEQDSYNDEVNEAGRLAEDLKEKALIQYEDDMAKLKLYRQKWRKYINDSVGKYSPDEKANLQRVSDKIEEILIDFENAEEEVVRYGNTVELKKNTFKPITKLEKLFDSVQKKAKKVPKGKQIEELDLVEEESKSIQDEPISIQDIEDIQSAIKKSSQETEKFEVIDKIDFEPKPIRVVTELRQTEFMPEAKMTIPEIKQVGIKTEPARVISETREVEIKPEVIPRELIHEKVVLPIFIDRNPEPIKPITQPEPQAKIIFGESVLPSATAEYNASRPNNPRTLKDALEAGASIDSSEIENVKSTLEDLCKELGLTDI